MPFCWFCHEAAHLSLFHRCELELTVIIPSFRTHRSEEQFDRSTLFIYFLYWKIASYTIKTGFFFYFLEMLRKNGFHHKIEVWSGCPKQTCFFLAYRIPMVRHPSDIVHTFKLEYLWSQLANLDQILCVASLGWGKGCIRFWGRLDQISGFHGNRNPHWLTMGKTTSPPFLGCFLSDPFYTCR